MRSRNNSKIPHHRRPPHLHGLDRLLQDARATSSTQTVEYAQIRSRWYVFYSFPYVFAHKRKRVGKEEEERWDKRRARWKRRQGKRHNGRGRRGRNVTAGKGRAGKRPSTQGGGCGMKVKRRAEREGYIQRATSKKWNKRAGRESQRGQTR